MSWYFADKVSEGHNVKRIALRQSPCGIPKVVVAACAFVLLLLTCCVASFNTIRYILYYIYIYMLNSSGSRISDKPLTKYSLLMVSNAFGFSSSKTWVELS